MDVNAPLLAIVVLTKIFTLALLVKFKSYFVLLLKRTFLEIYSILSNKSIAEVFKELYFELKAKNYKSVSGHLCLRPVHLLTDNEVIKIILQTAFNNFTHRGFHFNKKDVKIDENVFVSFHDEWKLARTQLTPAFTPLKMKRIVGLIDICSKQMVDVINSKLITKTNANVDIYEIAQKYFANISSCFVLGIDVKNFQDERGQRVLNCAKKLYTGQTFWRNCEFFFAQMYPEIATMLGISFTPKATADDFKSLVNEVLKERLENNVLPSGDEDMLKLMMDFKNEGAMTMEEVIGQCLIFCHGNFETSSLTTPFCLYELAKNQQIQDELREEINTTYELNEELTYEAVERMEYLRRVIAETLRKYPPVPILSRKCTKDYQMPNSNVVIKEGTLAIFSILGLQHDPEYYPDPLKFDPDRFIPEVAERRPPFTYLPFGGGPRNCIAKRMALVQQKVGLASLLRNFKFSLNEDTVEPSTFARFLAFLKPKHKIILRVERV